MLAVARGLESAMQYRRPFLRASCSLCTTLRASDVPKANVRRISLSPGANNCGMMEPMTPLDKTLKRALLIKGVDYVITLSPDTLKLTQTGKRLGLTLKWADLISGESALAIALQASVGRFNVRATQKKR
jgi:hypothetical protein